MNRIFDRSIYLDISTFDNLREKGKGLIEIINNLLEELILPFNQKLIMDTQKISGRRKWYSFNDKNWSKICDSLNNGEMQHVLIMTDEDNSGEQLYENPAISLSLTCDYQKEFEYNQTGRPIANNFACSLSERMFPGLIPLEIQKKMVHIFQTAFKELNCINGFLTFEKMYAGYIPTETWLEGLLELYYSIHSQNFKELTRGYFWGNIISELHIEKLGGIELVKNNRVCYQTKILEFNNRTVAYLQLTPDINNYSDDRLRELKRFLKPILPEEDMYTIKRRDPNGKFKERSRLVFD